MSPFVCVSWGAYSTLMLCAEELRQEGFLLSYSIQENGLGESILGGALSWAFCVFM